MTFLLLISSFFSWSSGIWYCQMGRLSSLLKVVFNSYYWECSFLFIFFFRIILKVFFVSRLRMMWLIKSIFDWNAIMINHKLNSNFNSHIIFGGTQELLFFSSWSTIKIYKKANLWAHVIIKLASSHHCYESISTSLCFITYIKKKKLIIEYWSNGLRR